MEEVYTPSYTEAEKGGLLALLDLPVRSVVSLDGQQVILKRDDFVGFSSIPDHAFHLATVRAGSTIISSSKEEAADPNQAPSSSVTVGFIFSPEAGRLTLIRRFDPSTEEVSSNPVDDVTASNLLSGVRENRIDAQRLVSYQQFLPTTNLETWKELTKYISKRLLERRGIHSGDKLVAGSYDDDQDLVGSTAAASSSNQQSKIVDGKSVNYPSIPVMDISDSVRHSQHTGTKRFMAKLSPSQRTELFVAENPASRVLEQVLSTQYDNNWEDLLGDVQLSYILFLYLQCFSSLSHWRDLVAMLSMTEVRGVRERTQLYSSLLDVLSSQIMTMERDFFDDMELSGDNFLVPSLQRLISTLSQAAPSNDDAQISLSLSRFKRMLADRFPTHFGGEDKMTEDGGDMMQLDVDEQEEGDNDGPVVVSSEEIEASLARSSAESKRVEQRSNAPPVYPASLRSRYPLLFAAMMSTDGREDVLMTCARALDEANDVSLVREAAAYLEEVEAKNKGPS